MTDPRFKQDGFDKRLSKVIEECGEVLHAAGKLQRWGVYSYDPFVPETERETNLNWLRRELKDMCGAVRDLDEAMTLEFGCDPFFLFYVESVT